MQACINRMKYLLTALLLFLCQVTEAEEYKWKVLRVIDGDTLEVQSTFLPPELGNLKIRVYGIDTPEKYPRSQCAEENTMALKATEYTRKFVANAQAKDTPIMFSDLHWDKYGGRVLARVNSGNKDLSEALINHGLARAYFGDKKESWCSK